jgi:hypothetical protein
MPQQVLYQPRQLKQRDLCESVGRQTLTTPSEHVASTSPSLDLWAKWVDKPLALHVQQARERYTLLVALEVHWALWVI